MTVLGLDCAGKTAGVALCRDGELFYESRLCAGFTHSETLLPLCEEALRACRLSLQDISLLAVTAGPGSFTGLRIGLATVKGLAFAHGTPCAGVSTLEALAFCAPPVGSCVCALDARRGEVYHAGFSMGPQGPFARTCALPRGAGGLPRCAAGAATKRRNTCPALFAPFPGRARARGEISPQGPVSTYAERKFLHGKTCCIGRRPRRL